MAQQFTVGMYGIKIAVKDYQNSIDFYTLLGMKMGPRHNPAEWELHEWSATQGSNIIMVHDESGHPGRAGRRVHDDQRAGRESHRRQAEERGRRRYGRADRNAAGDDPDVKTRTAIRSSCSAPAAAEAKKAEGND